MTTSERVLTGERASLLAILGRQRDMLRRTVRGLTDEQAATRSTVSALCLGGLVKHVAAIEDGWARFMVGGAEAMPGQTDDWQAGFRMIGDETLAGLLDRYAQVAARTDELVSTLDLDAAHLLPAAPWFEPGASWSVRQVVLHLVAEISQHAGHADILRESIDGARSMG
ncbi:DinB family protein [Micromonospora sp. KC721]|uniref:DinB family protein n=1 Tax=Micromonospora sp. KC721 TaxID=2530380 RepID=UPI0010502B67|nr:DinB family protein [Micromonospora sp. KC721]TDB70408.1 DinB family protein [Micromonospora sp. KC721]